MQICASVWSPTSWKLLLPPSPSSPCQHSLWKAILSVICWVSLPGCSPGERSKLANRAGTAEFCQSDCLGLGQVWNCSQEQLPWEMGGSSDLQALQGGGCCTSVASAAGGGVKAAQVTNKVWTLYKYRLELSISQWKHGTCSQLQAQEQNQRNRKGG